MTAAKFRKAVGYGANARGGTTRRIVTTLADDGRPDTLRAAATQAGSWVSFAPGMEGTVTLRDQIDVAPDVRIDGTGANITLSNGGPGHRTSGLVFGGGNGVARFLTFDGWGDPAHPTETQPFPHWPRPLVPAVPGVQRRPVAHGVAPTVGTGLPPGLVHVIVRYEETHHRNRHRVAVHLLKFACSGATIKLCHNHVVSLPRRARSRSGCC